MGKKQKIGLVAMCEEKGITLTELSKLSGVPISTIRGWTYGKKPRYIDSIAAVGDVLNCDHLRDLIKPLAQNDEVI